MNCGRQKELLNMERGINIERMEFSNQSFSKEISNARAKYSMKRIFAAEREGRSGKTEKTVCEDNGKARRYKL